MTYIFIRHTDWCSFFQKAVLDNHAHHNGVSAVEDELWHDLQLAREHCHMLELLLLLLHQLIAVLCELVEQVVDNVCHEDGHTQTVGKLLDVPLHFHGKCQDDSLSAKCPMQQYGLRFDLSTGNKSQYWGKEKRKKEVLFQIACQLHYLVFTYCTLFPEKFNYSSQSAWVCGPAKEMALLNECAHCI